MRRIAKFALWTIALLVIVIIGFRLAAYERETEIREFDRPGFGRMIETTLGEVYIEEDGPIDGPPVLLVHGSVGWSRFWHETSTALANAGYRAIAFDLAPMGYSERDEASDYSRKSQAQRIIALAQAMQIKPALVAHSFGAGPGTEAVMVAPEQFSSYVIVDGAIDLNAQMPDDLVLTVLKPAWLREFAISLTITNPFAMKPLLQMFLHKKGAASPEYVELLKNPLSLKGTTPELAKWLPTLLIPPADALSTKVENYAELSMPVGIIWGAEDTATPLSQGKELNALIKGSSLTVLDGLGHIPQIEDPSAFQEALLETLGRF